MVEAAYNRPSVVTAAELRLRRVVLARGDVGRIFGRVPRIDPVSRIRPIALSCSLLFPSFCSIPFIPVLSHSFLISIERQFHIPITNPSLSESVCRGSGRLGRSSGSLLGPSRPALADCWRASHCTPKVTTVADPG